MAIYDKKLDAVIKHQITREINQVEVPNLDDQWKKFQEIKLYKDNKISPHRLKSKWAVAALLLIIVGTYSLFQPTQVNAFSERIIEFFNKIVGRTTANQLIDERSTDMPTMEEPEFNKKLAIDKLSFSSLDEVKTAAPFDLVLPSYLPKGLKFKQGIITENPDNYEIKIIYEHNGNDLLLIQRKYVNYNNLSSLSILYDLEDNNTNKLFIDNMEIFVSNLNDNVTKLYWKYNDLYFILVSYASDITLEEMINIAISLNS